MSASETVTVSPPTRWPDERAQRSLRREIRYSRVLADENMHFVRTIRLELKRGDVLSAVIEETYSSIEDIARWWAHERKTTTDV